MKWLRTCGSGTSDIDHGFPQVQHKWPTITVYAHHNMQTELNCNAKNAIKKKQVCKTFTSIDQYLSGYVVLIVLIQLGTVVFHNLSCTQRSKSNFWLRWQMTCWLWTECLKPRLTILSTRPGSPVLSYYSQARNMYPWPQAAAATPSRNLSSWLPPWFDLEASSESETEGLIIYGG